MGEGYGRVEYTVPSLEEVCGGVRIVLAHRPEKWPEEPYRIMRSAPRVNRNDIAARVGQMPLRR